ncbi:FAD-dependent oxidoreductase [Stakelama sp. CBK3Z-3]|uniref:FAD-dependent oxidoreductase n=1 Tax=Stakelama flava TaxID=2860338 RepID=A0ABS6XQ14_9SPHN|nr:FAD-dependent oxidoreductase [Stakelama flava]
MLPHDFDLFVIGAGSGRLRAARVAAAHGARVALAEEFRFRGTSVIRGCVPKKLLVHCAHFAEDIRDARRFGWADKGRVRSDDSAAPPYGGRAGADALTLPICEYLSAVPPVPA